MTARKTAVKETPEAPAPEPQSDFQARLEAAAMRAGPIVEVPIDATFLPLDNSKYVSRRGSGWSAANQRAFLEAIAEGHGVDAACRRVGLSVASAYAFRRTAKGAPFALAWGPHESNTFVGTLGAPRRCSRASASRRLASRTRESRPRSPWP